MKQKWYRTKWGYSIVGPFYPIQWWWSRQVIYPWWKKIGFVLFVEFDLLVVWGVLKGLINLLH
jgi:hypothetical protein